MMYHTDPPPLYEEFLHGPISRHKKVLARCPDCKIVNVVWTCNYGVMVCPVCKVRLVRALSHRF